MRDRLNLRQRVMHDIGRKIVQGQYQPGVILPGEQELSEAYGVSRTVIREAVKGLGARGLLSSRPNVGATINERTEWQWLDSDVLNWALSDDHNRLDLLLPLYEAFAVVYPAVIENVAIHATPEEVAKIAAAYQRLEDCQGNIDAWDQAIDEWYVVFNQTCRNFLLQNIAIRLGDIFKAHLLPLTASKVALLAPHIELPWVPGSPEALRQHRQIYQCVEAHDSEVAFLIARRIFRAVVHNLQILTSDLIVRQSIETDSRPGS